MNKVSSRKLAESMVNYYAEQATRLMRKQPMSLTDLKQLKELREAASAYKGILAQKGNAALALVAGVLALILGLLALTGCAGIGFATKAELYEIETRDSTDVVTTRAKPFICRFRQCDAAGNVVQGS